MTSGKKPHPQRIGTAARKNPSRAERCPLVVMGASAGGLEVFKEFFSRMPSESGMAFIVIQHFDPKYDSLMPELLAKHTSMKVLRAEDGLRIEANRIYVAASSTALQLGGCTLNATSPPPEDRKPIDHFCRSVTGQGEAVVGVVLSGTGSDGSLGLRAIKAQGGLTIAQAPDTARYDSMPRTAIATGCVDLVLPVGEMPKKISEYIKHLDALFQRKGPSSIQDEALAYLPKIFPILHKKTGHDFSRYKQSTLARRIQRRVQVLYLDSVPQYLRVLREQPEEVDALFKDLLIGVTQFFRDPANFDALSKLVIPAIFDGKGKKEQVRVWVPGCATGEEAYTIAILLAEEAAKLKEKPAIQVFATDLDAEALEVARKATYPKEIAQQVSPERLKRCFKKRASGYELRNEIREVCVFSPHNLIKDPPFSRLDLLSCRNVLIYLEAGLQKTLLPLFHYSLNPCGFLFLGPSENIASRSEFFRAVDLKHRIFQRKPTLLHSPAHPPLLESGNVTRLPTVWTPIVTLPKEQGLTRSIERLILEELAPASVIINEHGEVLYFSGKTGKFLQPPAGAPTNKIVAIARKTLRLELRTAIHRAVTTRLEVVRQNLKVKIGGEVVQLDLVVRPLSELGKEAQLYLVLFRELIPSNQPEKTEVEEDFGSEEHPIVKQLESELLTTKAELQSTIEELETSVEELKSANEELLSMNEELQSANEELQTSKEEVQSVNEELNRKIEEAEASAAELRRAYVDRVRLAAIVENSEDAIISKTLDGIVTGWNPAAARIFGYTAAEMIGQSITRLIPQEKLDEETHILARLRRGERISQYETERVRKDGRRICISLTTSPIRDAEGAVIGAAKIARDITDRQAAEETRLRLAAVVESSDDAIITKSLSGTITSWNRSAESMYGYTAAEVLGKPVTLLTPPGKEDEEPAILERLRRGEKIDHYETIRRRKDGTLLNISLTVSPLRDRLGHIIGASKVARDISGRKQAEEARFRLAAVVESSDDAIISKTLDGIVTTWNKGAERIFGYRAQEMIGKHITEIFPPDRLGEEAQVISKIRRGERLEHFETVRQHKNGKLVDISLTVSPIKDPLGKVIGASKIARDITEQKRASEALRMNESRFRLFIEHAPAAIAMFDRNMCYQAVSHRWLENFELEQNVIGRSHNEVLPEINERWRMIHERALRGEVSTAEEEPFVRQDGSTQWLKWEARPWFDKEARIGGVLIAAEDVTPRVLANQSLQKSEEQLRMLADSIPQLAWMAEPDGAIFWYNQRWYEFTGTTFEQMQGWGWKSVHDPSFLPRVDERWQYSLRTGEPFDMEFPLRGADGAFRWFLTRVNPLRDNDGRIVRWFGSNTDVTEVRRAQEALKEEIAERKRVADELEKAREELRRHADELEKQVEARTASLREALSQLEEFSYSVSHDLRAPLRAIAGYNQIFTKDYGSILPAEAHGYLDKIARSTERMERLVNDVLTVSRVSRSDLRLRPIPLQEFIQEIVDLHPAMQTPDADLRIEATHSVIADDASLGQAISNLLSNAVKFVPEGTKPVAKVWSEASEGRVRLWIEDNGIGIPPQYRGKLFGMFQRLPAKLKYEGTGIGLAIVRKAVERMGGTVGMEANEPKGSRFWIELKEAE